MVCAQAPTHHTYPHHIVLSSRSQLEVAKLHHWLYPNAGAIQYFDMPDDSGLNRVSTSEEESDGDIDCSADGVGDSANERKEDDRGSVAMLASHRAVAGGLLKHSLCSPHPLFPASVYTKDITKHAWRCA